MSEQTGGMTKGVKLSMPASGSVDIGSEQMPWQDGGEAGFWVKDLFECGAGGLRTSLMKVDPGAFTPLHAHEDIEQIYLLSGSFYDQDRIYRAGDFIVRAPGAMHSAGSETGAVVLLVYSPAVEA